MPMKDNDIDTKVCMQFKVQGRNPRGGGEDKGGQSRSCRDKQSRKRVKTDKAKAKEVQEAGQAKGN